VIVATYNVNGVNGRLEVLLKWLEEAQPDIAILQELKAPDIRFPEAQSERLGTARFGMVRNRGTVSRYSLEDRCHYSPVRGYLGNQRMNRAATLRL
jgi:exonuclease III